MLARHCVRYHLATVSNSSQVRSAPVPRDPARSASTPHWGVVRQSRSSAVLNEISHLLDRDRHLHLKRLGKAHEVEIIVGAPHLPQASIDLNRFLLPFGTSRVFTLDRQPPHGGALQEDHRIVALSRRDGAAAERLEKCITTLGP